MTMFLTTFFMVFLMGWQQQNVTHGHYKMAFATSMLIAVSQFLLYKAVIDSSIIGMLYMGLGGSIGITLSMYIHRRWRKKNERHVSNK